MDIIECKTVSQDGNKNKIDSFNPEDIPIINSSQNNSNNKSEELLAKIKKAAQKHNENEEYLSGLIAETKTETKTESIITEPVVEEVKPIVIEEAKIVLDSNPKKETTETELNTSPKRENSLAFS